MKRLGKKIKGQARKARANLDRALLNLKMTIEKTGGQLATENELAWSIANKVLEKVKQIRKTLAAKPRATSSAAKIDRKKRKSAARRQSLSRNKKLRNAKPRRKARARS